MCVMIDNCNSIPSFSSSVLCHYSLCQSTDFECCTGPCEWSSGFRALKSSFRNRQHPSSRGCTSCCAVTLCMRCIQISLNQTKSVRCTYVTCHDEHIANLYFHCLHTGIGAPSTAEAVPPQVTLKTLGISETSRGRPVNTLRVDALACYRRTRRYQAGRKCDAQLT